MNINTLKHNFPKNFEFDSSIYGIFTTAFKDVEKISFFKNNEKLELIGGSLYSESFFCSVTEDYIFNLEQLLKNLKSVNGHYFFSSGIIKEIIRIESNRDSERGKQAPYFRVIV